MQENFLVTEKIVPSSRDDLLVGSVNLSQNPSDGVCRRFSFSLLPSVCVWPQSDDSFATVLVVAMATRLVTGIVAFSIDH
jgi:hypothetical protein